MPSKKVQPKPQEKQNLENKPALKQVAVQELDANGQILGRIATQIATILRGKNKPEFRPNKITGDKVLVKNASKIVVTGRKLEDKIYYKHTGYLGHLKAETLKDVMRRDPSEAIRRAVYGMIPDNKLRDTLMKNLEIRNEE